METIKSALSALGPPRPLTVHLLRSEARRTQALFEHARVHPKGTTVEDVLVLLYVHLATDELAPGPVPGPAATTASSTAATAAEGVEVGTVEAAAPAEASTSTAAGPSTSGSPSSRSAVPVLLVALQAQVYTLPSSSTTVIYLAKVDTTSYPLPSHLPRKPYARVLTAAFVAHHLARATRPTRRTAVQLFARSQAQYLFPDSGDASAAKRVLSGERLCRWWRAVLELAVRDAARPDDDVRLSYLLPGMDPYEASLMVGGPAAAASSPVPWSYGMRGLPRLFEPSLADGNDDGGDALGELIPTFEDDPRTRFLTDLTLPPGAAPTPLSTSSSSSGGIAKPRLAADAEDDVDAGPAEADGQPSLKAQHTALRATASAVRREKAAARLRATTEDAFWELLAFRQECSLGQTVGFFSLFSAAPASPPAADAAAPQAATSTDGGRLSLAAPAALGPTPTVERKEQGLLPKQLWLRLIATLLNQSFATPPLAVRGSATVWDLSRTLVGEWGALDAVEGRVDASADNDDAAAAAGGKRKAEGEPATAVEQAEPAPPKKLMAVRKKKKAE